MWTTAKVDSPARLNTRCLSSWVVLCAALWAVSFLGVSAAHADDGSWIGGIPCTDPSCTVDVSHNDFTPFKGNFTVTVLNSGSAPWGDFHFRIFDPMGGQDISNVSFLDASMGGYDPTSSQAGLRWTIDNVTVGARISLYFCSDPVMPGETATFVVYTANPDHLSFFGVGFYPSPVPPSGACCYPDGSCVVTCQYDCPVPGFWHGELTSCTPNPCPQPTGACCHPDGSCTVTLASQCQGPWTMFGTCVPNDCPQPTGSCCYPDGTCTVTTQVLCTGTWIMFGTCAPGDCTQPTGACCFPNGDCAVTLQLECPTGMWTMFGTCVPNLCPQPDGSCCYPDGTCAVTEQADCSVIWTLGGVCNPNTCLQPVYEGACCFPDGSCTVTLQANCAWTWILHGVCNPNPCPQPPIGVCCDPATGICTMTTQAACNGNWTIGGTCSPNPCPPIPTENRTWGEIKNIYR